MKIKRSHFLKLSLIAGLTPTLTMLIKSSPALASITDPLPAWQAGPVKTAILDFVAQATQAGGAGYIPPGDRIATFDNDGTLWCEKPLPQGLFVIERLNAQVETQPELADQPVVVALQQGNLGYFSNPNAIAELIEVLGIVSANMPQATFDQQAMEFLGRATHPQFGVKYTALGYVPQLELLTYLRANGFQTWICSGGGIDFIRQFSESMYDIAPQQVIGSSIEKEYRLVDDQKVIWRRPEIDLVNDKEGKPVGIDRAIGQPPVLACGNVGAGGDIAMLTYSQSSPYPSLQILINHDDDLREFAYSEANNASLDAASANGWQVVSIKNDWSAVFSQEF